jgi:RNA polymerase sigma factor (sigma-70 family)
MSTEPRAPTADQLLEHTAFLTRLARQVVGDEHRAEDVVQDAFALALERPPREARSLRGWLSIVVSNLARNERRGGERRAAREQSQARAERQEPGELALERLEVQRGLIELVVALPEEQRTVLYLRYYEDMTPSAIAEHLGAPVKTVKARHTRALAELRARLDARCRGKREAWVSALLPATRIREARQPWSWSTRPRLDARAARLALGAGVVLVAALAWLGSERILPASRGARTAALPALAVAPAPEPAPGAAAEPARELTTPAREAVQPAPAVTEATAERADELRLVLEVDQERARALHWARDGAGDAQRVEAAARVVARRARALSGAVRVRTLAESSRIEVVLPASDPRERELWTELLRNLGVFELLIVADATSLAGLDIDLAAEQQKHERWRAANPELPASEFEALEPSELGPHPRLTWVRSRFGDVSGGSVSGAELPLLLPGRIEDHLGAASFVRVGPQPDEFGYPAIWCEVSGTRWGDLARITEAHLGQRLAVVVGDELRSAPTLNAKWVGGGFLEGRFRDEEVVSLARSFRMLEGPLRVVEESGR